MPTSLDSEEVRQRNLRFFTTPALWTLWPLLPLVRYRPDGQQDLGLLYDALSHRHLPGHSATVFLGNVLLLPATEAEFLASPREVYDTPEEVYLAGWRVD
jgi:hypothetical protein